MGSEWPIVQLGEIVDFLPKRYIKKGEIAPFVSMADVPEHSREISNISEKEFSGGGSKFKNGDTIFARITPCLQNGKTAKVSGISSNKVAHGSTEFIVFSSIFPKTDQDFVYYLALDPEFRAYAESRMQGSTGRQRVAWQDLAEYKLNLPPKEVRKNIGLLLASLDNKIELNRQTNQTLEQMAQALFKSWFVDFDPVIDNALAAGKPIPEELQARAQRRQQQLAKPDHQPLPDDVRQLFPNEFEETEELGWVPKGWGIAELSDITTELRRGISPKYVEEGGVSVINQKCIRNHEINYLLCRRNNPSLRKVDGRELLIGDVLINSTGVGTLGRMAQVNHLPEMTVVDSHVTVVRPDQSKYPAYIFGRMMLTMENHIESLGEGSTGQTELSRKIVAEQKVLIPSLEALQMANRELKSFTDRVVLNSKEIGSLTKLRDTLLPKLISGELRLPESMLDSETNPPAETAYE
jgi:type I restriction enzyme S subunit